MKNIFNSYNILIFSLLIGFIFIIEDIFFDESNSDFDAPKITKSELQYCENYVSKDYVDREEYIYCEGILQLHEDLLWEEYYAGY